MFTKEMFKGFRKDFSEAVKEIEEKYGITIGIGNITYSAEEFHCKLTGEVKRTEDEQAEKGKKEFDAFARMYPWYKLKPEMYNAEVEGADGKIYTVIGINTKARKNIIIVKAEDGKEYVCPPEFLKSDKFETESGHHLKNKEEETW